MLATGVAAALPPSGTWHSGHGCAWDLLPLSQLKKDFKSVKFPPLPAKKVGVHTCSCVRGCRCDVLCWVARVQWFGNMDRDVVESRMDKLQVGAGRQRVREGVGAHRR